ncbi:hypothetical protein BC629DRAFT_1444391 [Irpex lacteus]|nr:hypothetical protein BC629DRAFT_1444391 [Irpex lacteus]
MSSFPTVPGHGHLLELAWDFRLTRSIWLMTYALLIYDYILTFPDEVLYMWTQKRTTGKLLFLLTRYWTGHQLWQNYESTCSLLITIPPWCKFSYAWFVYSELVTQTLGAVILILRIYAIYDMNMILLYGLYGFLAAVLLVQIVFSAILSKETDHGLNKTLQASGCIPNNWRYKPWVYWVPATTFDGILFLLAIVRSINCARDPANTTPSLLYTMLRDSFLYFGLAFVVIIADLVVWTRASSGLYVALPELVPVLYSIMSCRMLLNMTQASRPYLAQPWKERDEAVFSEAIRLMSFWNTPDLNLPTSNPSTQPPDSPLGAEP